MKIKELKKAIQDCDDNDEVCLMIKGKEGQYIPINQEINVEIQKQQIIAPSHISIPSQILNSKDAAMYIGMSEAYLKASRIQGKIGNRAAPPKHIKMGKSVRYSIKELDAWLKENLAKTKWR